MVVSGIGLTEILYNKSVPVEYRDFSALFASRLNGIHFILSKMEKSCSCCKDYGTGGGKRDEDILDDAALKQHHKCIENAVKEGADVNIISKALMRAVNLGDTGCIKILLTSVHDITEIEDDTTLCSALWSADVNIIELLLQTGADVNRPLILGQTPLIWMDVSQTF